MKHVLFILTSLCIAFFASECKKKKKSEPDSSGTKLLVVNPDVIVTSPLSPKTGNLTDNDTDLGTTYTVTVSQLTSGKGTIVINPATGNYTYTPASGFTGTTSTTYTVCNANACRSASISISVNPCSVGYTGINCATQITPTKITITGVKITKFPAKKIDGNTWDNPIVSGSPNPDILVQLRASASPSFLSLGPINDAVVGTSYYFSTAAAVTYFGTQYQISMYEDDSPSPIPNELMGSITFDLYTSSNRFPTTLVIDNGTVGFELTLQYTY